MPYRFADENGKGLIRSMWLEAAEDAIIAGKAIWSSDKVGQLEWLFSNDPNVGIFELVVEVQPTERPKVIGLHGQSVEQVENIEAGVVDILRCALAEALAGNISELVVIAISKKDGDDGKQFGVSWEGSSTALLGGVARAEYLINKELDIHDSET